MTVFKTRPGVVLSEICGEYVLVSAKKLQDLCPYISQINESSAFLWKQLEKGMNQQQLIQAVETEYETDNDIDIRESVHLFLQQMLELNYLICTESDKENEKEI